MGLDITSIIRGFIKQADEAEGAIQNGRYDRNSEVERNIFAGLLKDNSQLSDEQKYDIGRIYGLELSANPGRANAPKKAPEGSGDKGYTIGDGGTIIINNTWNINIVIQNDTKELIQQLIEAFNNSITSVEQKLEQFFNEQNNNNLEKLMELFAGMFQQYVDYNDIKWEDLQKVLNYIAQKVNTLTEQNQQLTLEVEELNKTIKEQTLKQLEMFALLDIDVKGLKAAVEKNGEKLDEQVKWLQMIYNALKDITSDLSKYNEAQVKQINEVIELLKAGNIKLESVAQLLELIRTENAENTQKIIDEVKNGTEVGKQILEWLQKFEVKFDTLSDDIKDKLLKILNKEFNLIIDGKIEIDTSKIEAYLESMSKTLKFIEDNTAKIKDDTGAIKEDTAAIKERQDKLIELVDKYGVEFGISLQKIVENQGVEIDQLDKIIYLLDKIGPQLKTLIDNQEIEIDKLDTIISLINKYGPKLNEIIDKMQKFGDNFDLSVTNLMKFLAEMDDNDDKRMQLILGGMDKIYNKIGEGGGNSKDYTEVLNAILAALGDLKGTIEGEGQKVRDEIQTSYAGLINAIAELGINFQNLMEKYHGDLKKILNDILEAIKNHEVVVTVDVTGKVECHCTHDDETPHEGVLGELEEVFNVKANHSWEDSIRNLNNGDTTTAPDGNHKVLDPRRGVVIKMVKGGKVVCITDLSGRNVR